MPGTKNASSRRGMQTLLRSLDALRTYDEKAERQEPSIVQYADVSVERIW